MNQPGWHLLAAALFAIAALIVFSSLSGSGTTIAILFALVSLINAVAAFKISKANRNQEH